MKKVAIATLYGEYNLGNKLQNFAVEYLLRDLGCTPITLVTSMYQSPVQRCKYFLLGIMSALPIWKDRRLIEHRMMKKRCKTIRRFSDEYLHYSRRIDYKKSDELKRLNAIYDLFITGSDQVWGSFIDLDEKAFDYYFLKFADFDKRGSLSPSLGRDTVPAEKRAEYEQALNGIRWLSCRENGMRKLIAEVTGRDAELLLDPTMAVPVNVWRDMESKPVYKTPCEYILDYRLGTNKDSTDLIVERISGKVGIGTVNIYDTSKENEIFEKTGPGEFLWLIDNASLVVTDSFHGCVFSILFKKEFICIARSETSKSVNMSDRLETLLTKFGLKNRLYNESVIVSKSISDYSFADRIISDETDKIRNYIQKMIEEKD